MMTRQERLARYFIIQGIMLFLPVLACCCLNPCVLSWGMSSVFLILAASGGPFAIILPGTAGIVRGVTCPLLLRYAGRWGMLLAALWVLPVPILCGMMRGG